MNDFFQIKEKFDDFSKKFKDIENSLINEFLRKSPVNSFAIKTRKELKQFSRMACDLRVRLNKKRKTILSDYE